ncbi:competence/damage-inducible protein A [Risungbinella massiliensis]|uniref:competence/damage-inducible protein A n=1 Tax=Risungbinella massiliensis TaxID=1329796 RepID=UPI00069A078D|nr:competence/damage-inducible protein A [Risungbinella massiliensis]
MVGEVITVGSELVMGHTLDTHSQYIAKACSSLGLEIRFHTSVGDNWDDLTNLLRLSAKRSSFVFLCGGLGPTMDDLTKEALAEVLGMDLVQDESTLIRLKEFFQSRNRTMTENNLKQTYVFPNGTIFANPRGTAPGLAIQHQGVTYCLLPGPPNEMRPMWHEQVEPYLNGVLGIKGAILARSYSFVGIGESRLEAELQDLIQSSENPVLATYAGEASCTLRFTAKAPTTKEAEAQIEQIASQVRQRVGEYVVSTEGQNLEQVICQELDSRGQTVSFTESCTGGLMTHLMTTVPGSSSVVAGGIVSYQNSSKRKVAKVPTKILEQHGAISPETAREMAQHSLENFASDWSVSVTGVAGPDSSENQPVGLIYFGLAHKGEPTKVYQYQMSGSRQRIQRLAAIQGLFLLLQAVRKGE